MWLIRPNIWPEWGIYFLLLLTQVDFFGATFYFLETRKFSNYFYFLESNSHLLLTTLFWTGCSCLLQFAWVIDDAKCIVVTRVCVCVYVSVAAVRPHYCTDPDVTWGHGRGCPLVVHCWADLQSGHGLRCYGNITRILVTSLRPSRDMTT